MLLAKERGEQRPDHGRPQSTVQPVHHLLPPMRDINAPHLVRCCSRSTRSERTCSRHTYTQSISLKRLPSFVISPVMETAAPPCPMRSDTSCLECGETRCVLVLFAQKRPLTPLHAPQPAERERAERAAPRKRGGRSLPRRRPAKHAEERSSVSDHRQRIRTVTTNLLQPSSHRTSRATIWTFTSGMLSSEHRQDDPWTCNVEPTRSPDVLKRCSLLVLQEVATDAVYGGADAPCPRSLPPATAFYEGLGEEREEATRTTTSRRNRKRRHPLDVTRTVWVEVVAPRRNLPADAKGPRCRSSAGQKDTGTPRRWMQITCTTAATFLQLRALMPRQEPRP